MLTMFERGSLFTSCIGEGTAVVLSLMVKIDWLNYSLIAVKLYYSVSHTMVYW